MGGGGEPKIEVKKPRVPKKSPAEIRKEKWEARRGSNIGEVYRGRRVTGLKTSTREEGFAPIGSGVAIRGRR